MLLNSMPSLCAFVWTAISSLHGRSSTSQSSNSCLGILYSLPSFAAAHKFRQLRPLVPSICSQLKTGSTKDLQLEPTTSAISYPQSLVNPAEHPIKGEPFNCASAIAKEKLKSSRLVAPPVLKILSTAACTGPLFQNVRPMACLPLKQSSSILHCRELSSEIELIEGKDSIVGVCEAVLGEQVLYPSSSMGSTLCPCLSPQWSLSTPISFDLQLRSLTKEQVAMMRQNVQGAPVR
mmetsp:Transcript_155567/g.274732  ORF Transcript_155567/g.274732 Transcript_155567/m.274732 type:complete len:235 (+) Transcript_155567:394-1098(+)